MGSRGSKSRKDRLKAARGITNKFEVQDADENKDKIARLFRTFEKDNVRMENDKLKIKRNSYDALQMTLDDLLDDVRMLDDSGQADYKEIKSMLRGVYSISDYDKRDIADASKYIRNARKYITIQRKGLSLDGKYQELSERFPEYFDAERESSVSDQLQTIVQTMRGLENRRVPLTTEEKRYARDDMTQEIIKAYLKYRKKAA